MKTTLTIVTVLLALLAQSPAANAQVEQDENDPSRFRQFKNELSFGIVGAGDIRQQIWAVPGFNYKYYLKNGAIRVLAGGSYNESSSGGGQGFSQYDTEYGVIVRAGYQYHVPLGRFMPILGCDASFGAYGYEYNYQQNLDKSESTTFGVNPNLGIQFFISPKISLLLDTRIDFSYRQNEYTSEYLDWQTNQPIKTVTRSAGINTRVAPFSTFLVAFHF
ncbi:MAG: hypothetical protein WEC59_01920 [Salibacteraceae bacterium]